MTPHYYQDIQGWFDFQDIYAEAVASAPEGGLLVEVGCWKGKSLSHLLVEAANSGKRLTIVGVDHFAGSVAEPALEHEARATDLEAVCRASAERSGYPFRILRKPSLEAAQEFADGACAFVFIDGSHDYESVKADLAAWLPKVAAGGTIAGHDFGYASVAQAVREALPEVKARGSSWFYVLPKPEPAKPAAVPQEGNDETTKTPVRSDRRRLPRIA
jgi:hypothetical protein